MPEHPEIGGAERTGYPSWRQERPRRRRTQGGTPVPHTYRHGGIAMDTRPDPLKRMEVLLMGRMEQMLTGTNGLKFDSHEFKRNVSSLKEIRDMSREEASAQPRQTVTVKLAGETEGFAQ